MKEQVKYLNIDEETEDYDDEAASSSLNRTSFINSQQILKPQTLKASAQLPLQHRFTTVGGNRASSCKLLPDPTRLKFAKASSMHDQPGNEKLNGFEMPMHCVVESSASGSVSECETSFVQRGAYEEETDLDRLRLDIAP